MNEAEKWAAELAKTEGEAFEKALSGQQPHKNEFQVDDNLEQAFRSGYGKGYADALYKGADSRLDQIAFHYGYDAQREQFVEECAEAVLAVQKCKRHGSNSNFVNLCEEIADVLIMAQQMRLLMSTALIDGFIDKKLKRQIERIQKEEE